VGGEHENRLRLVLGTRVNRRADQVISATALNYQGKAPTIQGRGEKGGRLKSIIIPNGSIPRPIESPLVNAFPRAGPAVPYGASPSTRSE
jgi:hypothetical protein